MDARLIDILQAKLEADPTVLEEVGQLVLASTDGARGLARFLEGREEVEPGAEPSVGQPVGAYISSIAVEGFRGVGPTASLELPPGPGLTLVIGRNGSGKSSFAEALEVLFTGENQRWADRSLVWREGWRNLHHSHAAIEATLAVEGVAGATVARCEWPDDGDLDDGEVEVQPHGEKKTDLSFLGWDDALVTYRPFLSYSELGSMLDEGPSKLHDAVSSVLGLEDLTAAEKALRDARIAREKAAKATADERKRIAALVEGIDDDRARKVAAALRPTKPDLNAIEKVVTAPAAGSDAGDELSRLNRVCGYSFPDADVVTARADELRAAQAELAALLGTHVDRLQRGARLLAEAVEFRRTFGDEMCPVCATPGVLTEEWMHAAAVQAKEQAAAARESQQAQKRADSASRAARELVTSVPAPIQDVRELLDVGPVIEAWREWLALEQLTDASALAERLPPVAAAVRGAVDEFQARARSEVERRQDVWRPIASQVAAWIAPARRAQEEAAPVPALKQAERWLKEAAVEIRNDRFAPIADEAGELWRLLRQRSSVQLGRIELEGTGTRRKVTLDVTIDGVAGAALGVMSQGELHALALSLFLPRATLDESPFRFVVIDDPVQSMDPSRVDGLARVLDRAAQKRQVVVFTHDDRLPEAVRRLGIAATTIEVMRREGSVVELRPALTPIERHIEDARVLVQTSELPDDVASTVVPGFCRLALEAACSEAVRRRRIARGVSHAEVESTLQRAQKLNTFAALALFDDGDRGGDVLPHLNSKYGKRAADAFQLANKGVHQGVSGDLRDLIRDAATLARQLSEVS